ncbi:hypothetical protein MTR_2g037490 [Medicago truncatula]|uniref:Uncharacterized protein n=1 Tax=Medicago truncatula TaxID=3880 RepID=G7INI2_MEDTR|nr:hypothetical protein MTR_2g037490 [Medicago truncatula]
MIHFQFLLFFSFLPFETARMSPLSSTCLRVKGSAGHALNVPLFDYYRGVIHKENQRALDWVDNIPKEKWTQAYEEGRR